MCDLDCFNCIYDDCIRPLNQQDNDYAKKYYHKNIDKMHERDKARYPERRERKLAKDKEYREKNKERLKKYDHDRYLKRKKQKEKERLEALKQEVPICEKVTLSLEETSAYSGIGVNKLRELCNEPMCKFVIMVGKKRLIKRNEFEKFIATSVEI